MHVARAQVERWYRGYNRFIAPFFWACPLAAVLFVSAALLSPRGSILSSVMNALTGAAAALLFLATAGSCLLLGGFLFHRRIASSTLSAWAGLLLLSFAAAFLTFAAIAGFWKMLS